MSEPAKIFRSLPPVPLWTAAVRVPLTFAQLKARVTAYVEESHRPVLGHFRDGSLTISRSPSPRYQTLSELEYQQMAESVAACCGGSVESADTSIGEFRVLVGCREGYEGTSLHSFDEVGAELPDCSASSSTVLSARYLNQTVRWYDEPVLIITGPLIRLPAVYHLAHRWRQEQFSVENQVSGRTYTVVTAWRK